MTQEALAGEFDPEILVLPSQRHDVFAECFGVSRQDLLRITALHQVFKSRNCQVRLGPFRSFLVKIGFVVSRITILLQFLFT